MPRDQNASLDRYELLDQEDEDYEDPGWSSGEEERKAKQKALRNVTAKQKRKAAPEIFASKRRAKAARREGRREYMLDALRFWDERPWQGEATAFRTRPYAPAVRAPSNNDVSNEAGDDMCVYQRYH